MLSKKKWFFTWWLSIRQTDENVKQNPMKYYRKHRTCLFFPVNVTRLFVENRKKTIWKYGDSDIDYSFNDKHLFVSFENLLFCRYEISEYRCVVFSNRFPHIYWTFCPEIDDSLEQMYNRFENWSRKAKSNLRTNLSFRDKNTLCFWYAWINRECLCLLRHRIKVNFVYMSYIVLDIYFRNR